MAGETIKTEAVCLAVYPWSRTSHVVSWLTPTGRISTLVKGAERPKSAFLGQYDLNYTCEVLYYANAHGDVRPLKEVSPLRLREHLRGDYRVQALAGYVRFLAGQLAGVGEDCRDWYALVERTLDGLSPRDVARQMVIFDIEALHLAGLSPDFSGYDREAPWSAFNVERGSFGFASEGRQIRIEREIADFLAHPRKNVHDEKYPLDAARVISVFYSFHLDSVSETRRTILKMISKQKEERKTI